MHVSPYCLAFKDPRIANDVYDDDQRFFLQALKNAQFAMGSTHPNPPVGAVLVKNGVVIAEGFTHPPGGMHAEKHALSLATSSTKGATLYVTLEPCSHTGRTPPCTNAIIAAGIKRVVYGIIDPNPRVCGQGLDALRAAGIVAHEISHPRLRELACGVLTPFKTWVLEKRPFIVVKIATSADGYFAQGHGERTKITSANTDALVHEMRRASDAVMVGGNTARIDDPLLTARLGARGHGKQPASIVVSASGNVPENLKLCNREGARSLILVRREQGAKLKDALQDRDVELVEIPGTASGVDLNDGFLQLGAMGFTLIFVEAGPQLLKELVAHQLVDEILWFRSREKIFGDGPGIPHLHDLIAMSYAAVKKVQSGDEDLTVFYRAHPRDRHA